MFNVFKGYTPSCLSNENITRSQKVNDDEIQQAIPTGRAKNSQKYKRPIPMPPATTDDIYKEPIPMGYPVKALVPVHPCKELVPVPKAPPEYISFDKSEPRYEPSWTDPDSVKRKDQSGTFTAMHHTSYEGAFNIILSEEIRKSDPKNGDAVFGPGAYFSTQGPDHPREKIIQNNYGSEDKSLLSKANVVVEVRAKNEYFERCPAIGRDVYRTRNGKSFSFNDPDVESVHYCIRHPNDPNKYQILKHVKSRDDLNNI